MIKLFNTTALVMALALPATGFAQTTAAPADAADVQTDSTMMSNFLASRGQADMLVTDLIGHDVYARRDGADMQASGTADTSTDATGTATTDTAQTGTAGTGTDGTGMPATGGAMTSMIATDLDAMDNVGQINDVILSADGRVQALVIGVGGFLGVGEQDVAVTMDQVSFATDATNPDEMYVVINTSGEMLKTSPAFDRAATMGATTDPAGTAPAAMDGTDATVAQAERQRLNAPTMEREGYNRLDAGDVSIEMLIGKSVYGADDSDVGTVEDVIVDDGGAVKEVIIDFGGFLGMGTTQVALSFEELTILTNDGNADIRVYVDATKEQVQAMPTYTPGN